MRLKGPGRKGFRVGGPYSQHRGAGGVTRLGPAAGEGPLQSHRPPPPRPPRRRAGVRDCDWTTLVGGPGLLANERVPGAAAGGGVRAAGAGGLSSAIWAQARRGGRSGAGASLTARRAAETVLPRGGRAAGGRLRAGSGGSRRGAGGDEPPGERHRLRGRVCEGSRDPVGAGILPLLSAPRGLAEPTSRCTAAGTASRRAPGHLHPFAAPVAGMHPQPALHSPPPRRWVGGRPCLCRVGPDGCTHVWLCAERSSHTALPELGDGRGGG